MNVLITGSAGNLGGLLSRHILKYNEGINLIGRVPYFGDTRRFRRELLPQLKYRTLRDGIRDMRRWWLMEERSDTESPFN